MLAAKGVKREANFGGKCEIHELLLPHMAKGPLCDPRLQAPEWL